MRAFDPAYRGARFYKCDLQIHTPADRDHWRGPGMGKTETDMEVAAEAFIRRCYEVGLEVIGITDHNFASKGFLPYLTRAVAKLAPEFGYKIVIFPGFEITADVGKGLHVLGLFEPDLSPEIIDDILTRCGVAKPRFERGQPKRSTMRLPELLKVVQERGDDGRMRGIVILPHAQGDAGIFDTDRIGDWLQAEEFTNPDLYCIELPKAPDRMSQGWQRLLRSGTECNGAWQRVRPIACIMSSDAKAMEPGEGAENYVGFRHTWIKMSLPSIEALRQAFLDHESRVRFGVERPEDTYAYPKIRSLGVRGAAFLADQDLVLSPNLTTVIGGRGTGKSTLVEYLRVAMAQEGAVRGEDPTKNFKKLRQTIKTETSLRVTFEKEGQPFSVVSAAGAPPSVAEGPGIPDLARFFPVRVLSQKEIYAIAEDREARRRLVDDLIRAELDEIGRREEDLVREIRNLNQQIGSLGELREREKVLETERRDFEVRLARLKAMEKPLARWKGLLTEERFFNSLKEEAAAIVQSLRGVLDEIGLTVTTLGSELTEAPSRELTSNVAEQADRLLEKLKQELEQAVTSFEQGIGTLLAGEPIETWRATLASARAQFETLRTELAEQGTDPDLYLSYQRELREREVQLGALRKRVEGIDGLKERRDGGKDEGGRPKPGLMHELHALWRKATEVRVKAASELTESVPATATAEPFVKVSVEGFGDEQAFVEKLREEAKDWRRISRDDWDEFMRAVFRAGRLPSAPSAGPGEETTGPKWPESPMSTLAVWMSELREHRMPEGCPWDPGDRRVGVILGWLTEDRLPDLQLWRTPDQVRVQLRRQDGSLVGDLEEGPLSVGQRCTAVLALILARDEVPVIIDQPEEDLDNEFIFAELVPLLRKVKERRQVIVTSHNANIPVNGDAELVIALEARDERGRQKEVAGDLAVGGLDRPAVKRAVEDIMEGSEEAFRRRFEKYGF
jgi:energy-coupling factor transporter ATP-binding protein EcfA2